MSPLISVHLLYSWVNLHCVCVCKGQQVIQERLIIRDRLPGPLSCSPKTHTHAVCLDWRDMDVAEADTKRGQSSAPIVTVTGRWVDRQAPAATPDHAGGPEFLWNNQSRAPSIHFLSLSYTHTHAASVMGQHGLLNMCLFFVFPVTSDSHIQPFLRSDQMFIRMEKSRTHINAGKEAG